MGLYCAFCKKMHVFLFHPCHLALFVLPVPNEEVVNQLFQDDGKV